MKKQKIAGVLMIAMAVLIGGGFACSNAFTDKAEKKEEQEAADKHEKEETAGTDQEEDIVQKDKENDEAGKEEENVFEIRNLPDAYLKLMDTDRETIAGIIEKWLQENQDYANAVGVEFYDSCEFDQIENKYSFSMKTIISEEGYAEESRILVVDYYMEQGIYQVHP